ncbi:MAG: hypothetical protein WCJ03_00895 [Bacteroidales bacterium]|jgi:hypothetical protein
MKKKDIGVVALSITIVALFAFIMQGCVSQQVTDKSGVQLWGENCTRCHDAPSPGTYTRSQWDVIGKHMRVRANLTQAETQKIVDYLKESN